MIRASEGDGAASHRGTRAECHRLRELVAGSRVFDGQSSPFRKLPAASGPRCSRGEARADNRSQVDLLFMARIRERDAGSSDRTPWRPRRSGEIAQEAFEGRRPGLRERQGQRDDQVSQGRDCDPQAWLPSRGPFSSFFAVGSRQGHRYDQVSRGRHCNLRARLPAWGAFSSSFSAEPRPLLCQGSWALCH